MGLHQNVAFALVVLMALGTFEPPQVDAQLCFYYLSSIRSYSVAVRTYYRYRVYYSWRCGWWGWRRCYSWYWVYVYYYYYYTAYHVYYIQKHYCCSGYSGANCDPICYNWCGRCSSCISPYNCACQSGWTGYACCSDYNECSYNNGGCEQNCHNTVGSFYCSCQSGYSKSGTHCYDINECSNNNGGCSHTCHNTNGGYYCDCPTGFTLSGKNCVDNNECSSNNGGCEQNCINQVGTYHCTCNAGYDLSSNKHNCDDHNECTNGVANCNHHCVNTPGSYYCYCNTGYELDIDDETCIDTNECNNNNGGCAQHCTNTIGSYYCTCDSGYNLHGDKHACVDIDECALNTDGCDHFCYNNVGSYTCDCKVGYLLHDDDHSCHDINECLTDYGGCDKDNGTCHNEVGTYHCECNIGFLLDDDNHGCSDHDECATNVHDCDTLAPATCHNSHGSFYCTCPIGFRLNENGRTCDDINECDEHTSGCTQICNNIYGSYFCTCHDGFSLDPDKHGCSDIDECLNNPCQDTCNNLIGSYYCSCNTGYTLADDKHSCVGIPCNPQLEAPTDGAISCTGLQVTDETCTIGCRAGFELMGSATRTCQANGLWTGVPAYCQHLYCHNLQPPTNGYISTIPCTSYFESTCQVQCVDGYYINGPSPHTETCAINANNELYWYPQHTCQYIPPCLSQPCQHGGQCHEVTMTSYYCDCGTSLYTGQNCETGYISVGDLPPVNVGDQISIPISGTPDNSVSVTVTVSSSAVNVSQTQYTFDSNNPSSSIQLSISTPGIYSINYALSGEDADSYDTPDPSILIVVDPNYEHIDNDYFLKNQVEVGELVEGCCSPGVQYQCPGGVVNTVSFSSSCAWDNLGPSEFSTPGVVFAKGDDIKIPVSITGAHLMMSEDSYDGFVLPDLSEECRVCDNTDPVNCNYFDFTANDYLDLLKTRALETTYLKAIDGLLPSWMTITIDHIEITGQTAFGVDDFTSYLTTGENIYEIPGCESLDLEPDSLFAVLSQDKNITVDIDGTAIKYMPSDSEGPVCFAVNLCKGSNSPVHITVPTQAVEYITSYDAIQAYINSGWSFTFKEFLMSDNDLMFMDDGHTSLADTYWVGTDDMVSSSDVTTNFEWRSSVEIKRQFWQDGDNLAVNVSFSGDLYHQSSPSGNDVEGVLSGDLSLSLSMSVNGKQGYMSLFTTSTAALFTMPDSTSSSSAIPSGISMRSTYSKNSMDQIFNSILPIPDGQDSCPVDVFVSLTSEGEINYIRMRTDCLNAVVSGYLYSGDFTHEIYITGKSIPTTPSTVPDDTVFAVFGYLNDDEIQLTDSYSIQQPTSGEAAIVLIYGANADSADVSITQASFSLLGTTFTTSLSVGPNGMSFSTDGTVSLYNGIETTLSGTIPQGSSWNDFVINLQGTFSTGQGSFQANAQGYIYDFTESLIQDSEERLEASTIAANDAAYAQAQTDSILNDKQNAVNDLMHSKDQAMTDYQNAQQMYNNAWQEYSNLESTASNEALESVGLLRNICMATDMDMEWQNDCLSSANCKLMPMSKEVLEWGLKKKLHTEQRLVHSVRDVTKLKWGIENYCQLITVIQGWGRTKSAQRCSFIATYDNITNTMLDAYYDTVEVMRTEAAVTESGTFSYDKKNYNLACPDWVANGTQHYTDAACDTSRKVLLEGLQNSDDELVVAFLKFESAKRNMMAAETKMKAAMVAYNASVDELASLKVCLQYTDPNLNDFIQTIQEEEGPIQALKVALQNSNIQDIFSISSIRLDTDFTDSDSIPLTIDYNVQGNARTIKITVELTATPQLINRAIADAILKDIGVYFQSNRKKRQATVENTFNVDQFQTRCGQLNGIKLYLDTIYESLESTYDTYMMAKSNITEAVAMVDRLMASMPTEYPTIDFQYLKDMYNYEISIPDLNTQLSTAVPVSNRTAALMSLKQALMAHMEGLDNYYYRCWQNDLRKMHSMGFIDTVGHIRCYGVVDCFNMVHEVIGTIANDMPETNTARQSILDALPSARWWLIAMSLYNSSLTMETAMATNATGMPYLIDMIMRENYWCTDIPVMSMHPQTEISVEVGDTLSVKCSADSVLPVTYTFERNGFLVATGLTTGEFTKPATEYDSGLYQCFATNAVGTVESKLSNVIVYIAPKITLQPVRYETFEGDDNGGFFACNATGYPLPMYEWEYSANGNSWAVVKNSKSNELIIPKPTQSDEGWYRCKVQTDGSGVIRSDPAHLSVLNVTFSTLSHKVSFLMNVTELDLTPGSGDSPAPTPPAETVNLDYFRDQLNLTYTTVDDLHVDFNTDNTQITVHVTMSVAMNYSATLPFDEQADWAAMKKQELMMGIDALQVHVKDGTFWFESEGSYFKAAHISANLNDPVYSCPANFILAYSNFLCVTCSIGTYYSMVSGRGVCTACPITYYSSQDGQTECVRCPERTDTLGTGSMWLTDCIDYCLPNYYSSTGLERCMMCPNNTYSLGYRATECTNCTDRDVGVIPRCVIEAAPTKPIGGNVTTTIIPAVLGALVGLLILIVLVIIIIVMAIKKRKSNSMFSNAPITGGGSNPLYAAPQDVLSLVPESEKTEYQVDHPTENQQNADDNNVVNPLYDVQEKEDMYDEDEPPMDNPYEKLDEYQSKMVQ